LPSNPRLPKTVAFVATWTTLEWRTTIWRLRGRSISSGGGGGPRSSVISRLRRVQAIIGSEFYLHGAGGRAVGRCRGVFLES